MVENVNTVLITGSSKGIGASLALIFAQNKCDIILHGRDTESLLNLKANIVEHKVRCETVVGDITDYKTIDQLKDCAEERGLNILINNAGIYVKKSFLDTSINEFKRLIDVNYLSIVMLTQELFPILKRSKRSLIININSVAGKVGASEEAAYSASKHALKGFSDSIKFDATKFGIRIMNVYLGGTKTQITQGRDSFDKLIDPAHASETIYNLSKIYDSLKISDVDLERSSY
jgi:short-subunit dehydrogenase